MARSRSTPAKRGPVRGARRRSRWESRPGPLVVTGWLLIVVAVVGAMLVQAGGGSGPARPADTALPSRPAAGPDAGGGTPGNEDVPAEPEDTPEDAPEEAPDEPAAPAPQRRAPAPESPRNDDPPAEAPVDVPDEAPVDVPDDESAPVDPFVGDRYAARPDASPEPVPPYDEPAPVAPSEEESPDVVPFVSDEAPAHEVAPAEEGDGSATTYQDGGPRDGGADAEAYPVDVDSPDTTLVAPEQSELRSYRTEGDAPTSVRGADRRECHAREGGARTGDRIGARPRDRVGEPGDRYRSASDGMYHGHPTDRSGPDGGGSVTVPPHGSQWDGTPDGHDSGYSTPYPGE